MTDVKCPKKLIEVALPLDDINAASAREKSIRHGHPSTLHLWWARRPLAAARAVLFAQLVNDPGYEQGDGFKRGVNKKKAEIERERLFQIIRDLVKWENTNNEEVLGRARAEIKKSWEETCHLNRNHPQAAELFDPEKLPPFHDPFAGGGAIPLEAQRLGLEAYASDLNPVAVMINKAMIEIPPKFAGRPPVGPIPEGQKQSDLVQDWSGAKGLAEDVRRYGHWMREEAFKRIGHLYPKVKITDEMVVERPDLEPYRGQELTVIAWLWARTVKSPNPAFSDVDVPLIRSFVLSKKKGDSYWIEPKVDGSTYEFCLMRGASAPKVPGTVGRSGGVCLVSGAALPFDAIRQKAMSGELGERLLAVVIELDKGRTYLPPHMIENPAPLVRGPNLPGMAVPRRALGFRVAKYGISEFRDLFTLRQQATLDCFTGLTNEVRDIVRYASGCDDYASAVASLIGISVSKSARFLTTLSVWRADENKLSRSFGRQTVSMTWDFAEANPFAGAGGDIEGLCSGTADVIRSVPAHPPGFAMQSDATNPESPVRNCVVSTDPPYYDNIGYADLSDYFYYWMRQSLRFDNPRLFSTIKTPKSRELIANRSRHESKAAADDYFVQGMSAALSRIATNGHDCYPFSIYYAFKQSNTKGGNTSSSGWEVFLDALISIGVQILATWPVLTEGKTRVRGQGANALSSSIVLVCRRLSQADNAISRRDFQRHLRDEMPEALEAMIGGESGQSPIAPVDLAQASIGPGMAIFSKYSAVLNQDGSKMSVHDALVLVNRAITEFLSPDSGNFDADTQFCSAWFDQYAWSQSPFGDADILARAKGTSVEGVAEAGVLEATGGKVRLLKWAEYESDWDPTTDKRTPIWEACHQLIRRMQNQGESSAGELLAKMPEKGEPVRQLAYHLYTLCERKKWAEDARAYNELIASWPAIVAASHESGHAGEQVGMDF